MFAVLKADVVSYGIVGRILGKLKPIRATRPDQKVAGLSYILVDVRRQADGSPPWDIIGRRLGGVPLVPPGDSLPPESLPVVNRLSLWSTLLQELSLRLLDGLPVPPARRTVALLDRAGEGRSLVAPLLDRVGTLRVCTLVPEQWEELTDQLLAEEGVFLQVGGPPTGFGDCSLVLAPTGWDFSLPAPPCPLLAPQRLAVNAHCLQLTQPEPAIPEELAAALPETIDPAWVLAAAYGDGQPLPVPLITQRMQCGPRWVTPDEVLASLCTAVHGEKGKNLQPRVFR